MAIVWRKTTETAAIKRLWIKKQPEEKEKKERKKKRKKNGCFLGFV